MRYFLLVLLIGICAVFAVGQECLKRTVEVKPELSAATKKDYELKLAEAFAVYTREKESADSTIWLGRRLAYLGNYKDAIRLYGKGLSRYRNDARLWRHRGHRFITRRCFDEAIGDLKKAAELTEGKPDEVEPDGIPNAKNIPVSTLKTNIWYHLGLAYYLKGDLENALKAYEECKRLAKNNDMRAATTYWQYMTLRRLRKNDEAKELLDKFDTDVNVIENLDYLKLLKLNKDEIKAEDLLSSIRDNADSLTSATLGYGIGNYFLYNGDEEKAMTIFKKIVKGNQWASFGYIAAEAELKTWKPS